MNQKYRVGSSVLKPFIAFALLACSTLWGDILASTLLHKINIIKFSVKRVHGKECALIRCAMLITIDYFNLVTYIECLWRMLMRNQRVGPARAAPSAGPHAIHLDYSATRPLHPSLVARYARIASISALTLDFVTVVHFTLPVAGLFIEIESQSRRASDLFKTWPSAPALTRNVIKINDLKEEVGIRKSGSLQLLLYPVDSVTEVEPFAWPLPAVHGTYFLIYRNS